MEARGCLVGRVARKTAKMAGGVRRLTGLP